MTEYKKSHKHALSLLAKTQNVLEKLTQVAKVVSILCALECTFCCLQPMLWQWLFYCTGFCAKALQCYCNILQEKDLAQLFSTTLQSTHGQVYNPSFTWMLRLGLNMFEDLLWPILIVQILAPTTTKTSCTVFLDCTRSAAFLIVDL